MQRQETERERVALASQLHLLARDVLFERQLGIAQLVGLLSLFFFVALTRGAPQNWTSEVRRVEDDGYASSIEIEEKPLRFKKPLVPSTTKRPFPKTHRPKSRDLPLRKRPQTPPDAPTSTALTRVRTLSGSRIRSFSFPRIGRKTATSSPLKVDTLAAKYHLPDLIASPIAVGGSKTDAELDSDYEDFGTVPSPLAVKQASRLKLLALGEPFTLGVVKRSKSEKRVVLQSRSNSVPHTPLTPPAFDHLPRQLYSPTLDTEDPLDGTYAFSEAIGSHSPLSSPSGRTFNLDRIVIPTLNLTEETNL